MRFHLTLVRMSVIKKSTISTGEGVEKKESSYTVLLPSIFPNMRVFSNESALCSRWPKYWSFSFSISRSNEYSGLISFRIDLFDLLAVQGTLKRLLQYQNSKASVLRHSAFFMVQLSHLYMTAGKAIALTIWTSCQQSAVSAI